MRRSALLAAALAAAGPAAAGTAAVLSHSLPRSSRRPRPRPRRRLRPDPSPRRPHCPPRAARQPPASASRLLVFVVTLAARDDAAAVRRAARDESRERRTPHAAACGGGASSAALCTFCSFFTILPLWLDAQRGSQLTQEQPRGSSRRAVERGVQQRAQRRDRGAVRTRGRGRALVSVSAHCGQKWPRMGASCALVRCVCLWSGSIACLSRSRCAHAPSPLCRVPCVPAEGTPARSGYCTQIHTAETFWGGNFAQPLDSYRRRGS
eukprot:1095230-Prymnesium_polylepis.1